MISGLQVDRDPAIHHHKPVGPEDAVAAPKDGNPVWMLFVAHFVPCNIIFQHYMQAKPMFFHPRTQEEVAQAFIAYTHLWMALLYVVAEAFRS